MREKPRLAPRLALAAFALSLAIQAPVYAQSTTTLRTGSGFAVSRATHIVTNAHVVNACKSIRVLSGTQQSSARVLAIDTDADLAVLQSSLSMSKTLAMRSQPAL